jgi:uncharacterized protein involved in outer membrane biogenesis
MRRFAIGLGVAVAGLLLLLGAVWLVLRSIDWNEYKEPIARAAYDATGRQLDLGGDLSLEIGFTPGVRIEGVRFANAAWGSRPQMASLEQLVVRLELLPLLSRNVVVDRVEVVGLDVLLETRSDGVANWQFESAGEPAPPPAGDAGEAQAPPFATLLRSLRIENAVIGVRDRRSGSEQRIAIARLVAETAGADAPTHLELDASYADSPIQVRGDLTGVSGLAAGAPLGLDLTLAAGGAQGSLRGQVATPLEGSGLDLEVALEGSSLAAMSALSGGDLPDIGPYRVSLALRGGGERFAIEKLDLHVGESSLAGDVKIDLSRKRPRIEAKLASPLLAAADFQESGTAGEGSGAEAKSDRVFSQDPLPLEGLGAADASVSLSAGEVRAGGLSIADLALELRLAKRKLRIDPLRARVAGGRAAIRASLDAGAETPAATLAVELRELVLGELLRSQGSEILSEGPLDLDLEVAGAGASVHEIMASLEGSLGLRMGRARVEDEWVGLALSDVSELADAVATRRGGEIGCALASLPIRAGVARPDALVVDLGSVALFGAGQVDLGSERIDLRFDRQSYRRSASRALPPFLVRGTLAEPKPGLDPAATASHVIDLASAILGKDKKDAKDGEAGKAPAARPASCAELLASYRAAGAEPASTSDVASQAADLVGGKTGKKAKKVVEGLKGLLEPRPR